jgi:DNA-binding PadR family transcriptional regulator
VKGRNPKIRRVVATLRTGREALVIDLVDCPCTGKNLARLLHPAILTVLAQESLHGYRILERLADETMFHGQPPDPAGVYRILKSMEQEGLVTCNWDLQSSGPARRQYTITERGMACLSKWLETITTYQNSITMLRTTIRKALGV